MGHECIGRRSYSYACDQCGGLHHWPPHTIATIRTQRAWFFCQRSCWIAWMRGELALTT